VELLRGAERVLLMVYTIYIESIGFFPGHM
jgi:hypothetical protein